MVETANVQVGTATTYSELEMARRLELLKAAADPIRLAVLDRLADVGARCHCDLEEELGLAANRLAFHLKVLKQAGLVTSERRGRRVRYHLQPGALDRVRAALPVSTDLAPPSAHCTACDADNPEVSR